MPQKSRSNRWFFGHSAEFRFTATCFDIANVAPAIAAKITLPDRMEEWGDYSDFDAGVGDGRVRTNVR
jgi:hypothetical protein